MKSFTVSAACARWAAPLAALGLWGCTALPQADELEALASQRAAQQQAVLAQAQAWARTEASQWRSPDWADLASHALRVNLPWKVAEVAGWLAQDQAEQAMVQALPSVSLSRTQTRRDVDDALSTGSNAGVVRSLSAAELAWDVAGAGGVWLRARAAGQRSAQSQLSVQAAVQQVMLDFQAALGQAVAAQAAQPDLTLALARLDASLALTQRLLPLGLQDPVTVAEWHASLLELRRQVVAELAQGEQAREKLASLLQLDDARLLPQPLPPAPLPDPQRPARIGDMPWPVLVGQTLRQRRDLRELDLELEALRLEQLGTWFTGLPGIRVQRTSRTDSNPVLLNNQWIEQGHTASWSLASLLSAWQQHRSLGHAREHERLRQQLLAFSAVEQVRLARLNVQSARSRWALAAPVVQARALQRDVRLARQPFLDNDEIEQARAVAQHALAVAAQARNQADMQRAWTQWLTSVGLETVPLPPGGFRTGQLAADMAAGSLRTHWARLEQDAVQLATAQAQADPITAGARP